MTNPFQDQRSVGAAALTTFAVAILLANASGTAAPNSDSSRKLPSRLPTPAAIIIRSNPFIAFTVPHAGAVVNSTQRNLAGNIIPGQNLVINAPGRPGQFVPPPGGAAPAGAPAVVLLCDTWTAKPGSNQTPTAVFMVGRTSVIATAGDLVGGYRVARIGDGIVRFDTGDSLALGDCHSLDTSTTGNDSIDDTDGSAAAPAPTNTPPVLYPGARIVPNSGQMAPVPYGAGVAPSSRRTNDATPASYGADGDSEYGTTIYGKPAPTSAPYPIAIPKGR